MKKTTLVFLVVVLMSSMPIMAHAFSSANDETIHPPVYAANTIEAVQAAPAPDLATKKEVGKVSKRVRAAEGKMKSVETNLSRFVDAVSLSRADEAKKLAAVKAVGEENKTKIGEHEKKIKGVEEKIEGLEASIGDAKGSSRMSNIFSVLIAVAIFFIVVAVLLGRRPNNKKNVATPAVTPPSTSTTEISEVGARLEKKMNQIILSVAATPQKTADIVLAFDRRPIEVTVKGHKVIFHQDDGVLNRGAYQILLVKDEVVSGMKPEKYELEEVSGRGKAIDSIKRTMREYLNGTLEKLSQQGDSKAELTVALIESFKDTKKLEIVKL